MIIIDESMFDSVAAVKQKKGPFRDLKALFGGIQEMTGDLMKEGGQMPVFFSADGVDMHLGEGSEQGPDFVFELMPEPVPQAAMWMIASTAQELGYLDSNGVKINDMDGQTYQFRAAGNLLEVDSVSLCQIDQNGQKMPFVRIELSDTGKKVNVRTDVGMRPSTAAQFAKAFETSGKKPDGMPQAWLVYDTAGGKAVPTVPNFMAKKGNFVMVHMVTLDELAMDEHHDVAQTLRMMKRVPQDTEMIFQYQGKAYEIDTMEIVPGEGLRIEMRDWGEVDESKHAYSGTIREWTKLLAESSTDGVWATEDNGEIMAQSKQFGGLF